MNFKVKKLKVVPQYPLITTLKKEIDQNVLDIIKLKLDVSKAIDKFNWDNTVNEYQKLYNLG